MFYAEPSYSITYNKNPQTSVMQISKAEVLNDTWLMLVDMIARINTNYFMGLAFWTG